MKSILQLLTIAVTAFVIINCAGTQDLIGQRKIVDKNGDRPEWVGKDSWENDEKLYFTAIVNDQRDLALGKRVAKGEAVKQIVEKIQLKARTEFVSAVQGTNSDASTIGRFAKDIVGWVSDNIDVSGISPEKTYWEKYSVRTHTGINYSYDIFSLYSISLDDYKKAALKAAGLLKNQARREQDKKAEAMAQEFEKRLIQ